MKDMKNIRLVATDLDGTFLKNDHTVSQINLKALEQLGERDITRVVATGRNLKKVNDVLDDYVPFDFIVYSSGAGVYDWREKKHIFNQNISKKSSQILLEYFIQQKLNFHAFYPVPENHKHWYFRGEKKCEEFERYFQYNQAFAVELDPKKLPETELCQFLLIIPENGKKYQILKTEIEALCPDIRVIRATSPITGTYIWIEVFHHSVSKGNGVKQICQLLNIDEKCTVGIGNDYNDLDLLAFTQFSFLTDNAPLEIKDYYPNTPSNDNDAFAFAIQPILT
jgi:Cof subfamily protein (haloacid dehalogenase superfamily)